MTHENLNREEHVEGSFDHSFGFVFAVVFVVIGAWPLISGHAPRWWAMAVAGGFALLALVMPSILAVPNRLWMKLGLLLGKIVSPIALGILLYAVFSPMGFVLRLLGKDPLRLKRDADATSYWIEREPSGPPPQSMTNQF